MSAIKRWFQVYEGFQVMVSLRQVFFYIRLFLHTSPSTNFEEAGLLQSASFNIPISTLHEKIDCWSEFSSPHQSCMVGLLFAMATYSTVQALKFCFCFLESALACYLVRNIRTLSHSQASVVLQCAAGRCTKQTLPTLGFHTFASDKGHYAL